jgi:hypothetical protein
MWVRYSWSRLHGAWQRLLPVSQRTWLDHSPIRDNGGAGADWLRGGGRHVRWAFR